MNKFNKVLLSLLVLSNVSIAVEGNGNNSENRNLRNSFVQNRERSYFGVQRNQVQQQIQQNNNQNIAQIQNPQNPNVNNVQNNNMIQFHNVFVINQNNNNQNPQNPNVNNVQNNNALVQLNQDDAFVASIVSHLDAQKAQEFMRNFADKMNSNKMNFIVDTIVNNNYKVLKLLMDAK
jgi:glycogen synthase